MSKKITNIHRKTRKRILDGRSKLLGGRKFGKGFKGTVLDVCNFKKYDTNNLCRQLQNDGKSITKITLYISFNQVIELTTPEQIAEFIEFISANNSKHYVAKEFYNYRIRDTDFHNEINSYEPVYKALGDTNANLVGMPYANNSLLVGIEVEYKNSVSQILQNDVYSLLTNIPFMSDMHESSNKRYFVINRKCDYALSTRLVRELSTQKFDKMVLNILEELSQLETANIAHGDIKPDNIMFCGNKYRLIDWEQGRSLDYTKIKTSISLGACPAYYILKFGSEWKSVFTIAIPILVKITGCNDKGSKHSSQYILDGVQYYEQQFAAVAEETAFNRVKYTFDLFAFGLILYGILQHNTKVQRSTRFAAYTTFVNQIYKFKNAKEALTAFQAIL